MLAPAEPTPPEKEGRLGLSSIRKPYISPGSHGAIGRSVGRRCSSSNQTLAARLRYDATTIMSS